MSSVGKNPCGISLPINIISPTIAKNVIIVNLGESIKNLAPIKYLSLILLNHSSNFWINLIWFSSSPDFKTIEQSAGANVRATRVDKPIDEAMHNANCLNICPVIPAIKETGTNTAIKTNEVASTAPKTSFIVISVASLGVLPS